MHCIKYAWCSKLWRHLENEELAHDTKIDLTEAGHALQVVHESQQVGQEGQEDSQDDRGQETGEETADDGQVGKCPQSRCALYPAHLHSSTQVCNDVTHSVPAPKHDSSSN